jgi:hypothetical protein
MDIKGRVYGRLTAQHEASTPITGQGSKWECSCICGGSVRVRTKDLNNGNTTSCGCLKRETLAAGNGHLAVRRKKVMAELFPAAAA